MRDGAMASARRLRYRPFRLAAARYQAVFAARRAIYGKTLVLWVACAPDAERRAGVVVSRRTFRRAVDRNRAKRLMREVFRASRERLMPGTDLILVARAGMAGKSCQEVQRDFEQVCRRAGIWGSFVRAASGNGAEAE